ncbi:hypothetical protein TRIUR3_10548 [Triticum urartu]|uniref:WPP domain-containing protein n=1 Tax=Triticum urartu TaxID=4572 RepID=M7ZFJ7_TRIUA|nr:hypothetical protein TRIUR3_10548 [Triticum urartu]
MGPGWKYMSHVHLRQIPVGVREHRAALQSISRLDGKSISSRAPGRPYQDGIEVLQAYSKEVSRRLLELAKSRAAAAAAAPETPAEPSGEESEGSSVTAPPPTEE